MIIKNVKEYSNRKRIELNKKDGFNTNEDIILMSIPEYDNLINQLKETETNLNNIISQQESQQNNIDLMLDKITNNIDKTYETRLKDKDDLIKRLRIKLNAMEYKCNQFKDKINQLSALDIIWRKKHYQVINDFTDSIMMINNEDDNIIDTNIKCIKQKYSED